MPKKKTKTKKSMSWNELGKVFGEKVSKEFKNKKCIPWGNTIKVKVEDGGGFGRLLFMIALLVILNTKGYLTGIPTWTLVLLTFGFMVMKL